MNTVTRTACQCQSCGATHSEQEWAQEIILVASLEVQLGTCMGLANKGLASGSFLVPS